MALTYCEVCGVLIKGDGADVPEGVICGDCFASRQVMVESDSHLVRAEPAGVVPPEKIQFGCPYCDAVLRLAVPEGDRMHVRCPRCQETFFAESDGTVAARMEGNTTQVLLQEDVLPSLTPGDPTGTQPLRAMGRAENDRTRALRPLGDTQHRAAPSKAGDLELRDQPYSAPAAPPRGLRASDEGKISLDAADLRAKTRNFGKRKKGSGRAPQGKAKEGGLELKEEPPSETPKAKAPKPKAKEAPPADETTESSSRKGKAPKGRKASERFKAVSSGAYKRAAAKGAARTQAEERQVMRAAIGWTFVILPALLCGFLAVMSSRDAGLVKADKPTGKFLRKAGLQGDRAVRAMNGLLPPTNRIPGLAAERPKGGVAPLGSASAPSPTPSAAPKASATPTPSGD